EKLNKATIKNEKASLLISNHKKYKKSLEAEYERLSDTLDHLNYQKKQEMYEIEDLKEENALLNKQIEDLKEENARLNKQIDYLKTTLKNNLIVFEYQEHTKQPWFIQTNRGVEFNAFPYKKWEATTMHAIEQKLEEVKLDVESESTCKEAK
ncbi:MAG: hypothetical protein ACRDCC_06075, partial [Culicoidibacterales bacterium]